MTATTDSSGCAIELPEGFVQLPMGDITEETMVAMTEQLAETVGMDADENARAAAELFASAGIVAEAMDIDAISIGFFLTPDTETPVLIFVYLTSFQTNSVEPQVALEGLKETAAAQSEAAPFEVQLPSGRAVITTQERLTRLEERSDTEPLLQRSITLWAPHPTAGLVSVVNVSTNNWAQWEHVCEKAIDIFETLEWDPAR